MRVDATFLEGIHFVNLQMFILFGKEIVFLGMYPNELQESMWKVSNKNVYYGIIYHNGIVGVA